MNLLIVSFQSVRLTSTRMLLVIENVYLVLQILHLILAELVAHVIKVTTVHLMGQVVKVYLLLIS